MFGVLIAVVIAFVVAVCAFFLATVVGATFFRGEAGYGFGLVLAPLGALVAAVIAFFVALRRLNFSGD